jgi:branched-chain amino acid transport system substrate-binding protein
VLRSCLAVATAVGALRAALGAAQAGPEGEIAIGMSVPLSGGCASSGLSMVSGIEAGFREINRRGGIHGRRLRLVAVDDGFEPAETDRNVRDLVDKHRVFSLIGSVGSPSAIVSAQWANDRRVPLLAPMSGSRLLRRQPPDRYVMNLRPGFNEETEAVIAGLVDELGVPAARIGFLTPMDADGDAVRMGLARALKRRGYQRLGRNAHGDYPPCTLDVEEAVSRILDSPAPPLAVVMLCTTEVCAKFVRMVRREHLRAIYVALSMADSLSLARELGADGEGVVVSQVVPPVDGGASATAAFNASLGDQPPSSIAFEGYLATRLLAAGLERAGPSATAERFVDALERITDLDLGLAALVPWRGHDAAGRTCPLVIRRMRLQRFAWPDLARALGPHARALERRPAAVKRE